MYHQCSFPLHYPYPGRAPETTFLRKFFSSNNWNINFSKVINTIWKYKNHVLSSSNPWHVKFNTDHRTCMKMTKMEFRMFKNGNDPKLPQLRCYIYISEKMMENDYYENLKAQYRRWSSNVSLAAVQVWSTFPHADLFIIQVWVPFLAIGPGPVWNFILLYLHERWC